MKRFVCLLFVFVLFLPAISFSGDLEDAICGRWCYYWDTRPMNEEYNNGKPMMSFLINNYDFYLYEDGTMYFVSASIDKNGKFKLNYPAADGLWSANSTDDITIRTMKNTYKAKLDENGRLLVYIVEGIPYPFIRVPSYDFFAEQENK